MENNGKMEFLMLFPFSLFFFLHWKRNLFFKHGKNCRRVHEPAGCLGSVNICFSSKGIRGLSLIANVWLVDELAGKYVYLLVNGVSNEITPTVARFTHAYINSNLLNFTYLLPYFYSVDIIKFYWKHKILY